MVQAKFSIEEAQARFLNNHKTYGFKDKSTMPGVAIEHFQKELDQASLRQSADLYAEIYAEEEDLRDLTETTLTGWPE